jgi:predicted Zn finger-like uncharacterized protein
MDSALRIECPECGTSYRVEHLGLKTNPGDKAVVRCMCGRSLEVEFSHIDHPTVEEVGWFRKWVLLQSPITSVKKVIHARVDSSAG